MEAARIRYSLLGVIATYNEPLLEVACSFVRRSWTYLWIRKVYFLC